MVPPRLWRGVGGEAIPISFGTEGIFMENPFCSAFFVYFEVAYSPHYFCIQSTLFVVSEKHKALINRRLSFYKIVSNPPFTYIGEQLSFFLSIFAAEITKRKTKLTI